MAELQRRALHILEHAAEVEPREVVRRLLPALRLWHYPSFEAYKSWTLFVPRLGDAQATERALREVTWDNVGDCRRLRDPMEGLRRGFHTRPSITVRDATMPPGELEALLRAGTAITVPVLGIEPCVGLDGGTFGLEGPGFLASMRLEWWCDGPAEWNELASWADEMRAFFQRCLDDAAPAPGGSPHL